MNRTHFLQSLYVGTRKDKHEQSVRCFKKALDPCTSVLRRNGSCVVTLVTFLLQLQALSDGGPVLCDVQTHSIHASFSANSLAQRRLGVRKLGACRLRTLYALFRRWPRARLIMLDFQKARQHSAEGVVKNSKASNKQCICSNG
jgi:hypothetical protein